GLPDGRLPGNSLGHGSAPYDGIMHSPPLRHAVDPAGPEGVATQDPPGPEGNASEEAVRADRVFRVMAAARGEAAVPAERAGEHDPVATDGADRQPTDRRAGLPHDLTHVHASAVSESSAIISSTNSRLVAPSIAARATRTASCSPASGRTSVQAARRIRRARLRFTAPPIRLLAIAATRPGPGARNTTTRRPRLARSPSRMLEISRERTAPVR